MRPRPSRRDAPRRWRPLPGPRRAPATRVLALALALPLSMGGLGACVTGSACPDPESAECEHEAVVTFPVGLVMGSYELVLEGDRETLVAQCLDPTAAADNPEGIACDGEGFVLTGIDLANERELIVTVTPTGPEGGDPVQEAVRLEAIDEITPNGPDCLPICFVRNGQLRIGTGS